MLVLALGANDGLRGIDPAVSHLRQVDLSMPGVRFPFQRSAQKTDGAFQPGQVRRFPAGDAEIAATDVGDNRVVVGVDDQGFLVQLLDVVHLSSRVRSSAGTE